MEAGVITWELQGAKELEQRFRELKRELQDLRPELQAAGKSQAAVVKKRFADGGDPAWEDIAYWTRKRRKVDQTTPPLTDSGSMMESVTALVKGVKGSAFSLTKTELIMGSTEIRALALQAPERAIPARPFLYFTDSDAKAAGEAANESLQDRIRRKFGDV